MGVWRILIVPTRAYSVGSILDPQLHACPPLPSRASLHDSIMVQLRVTVFLTRNLVAPARVF